MSPADAALLVELLRLVPAASAATRLAAWERLSADDGLSALLRFEGAELWLYRRIRSEHLSVATPLGESLRRAAHADALRGMRVDEETEAVVDALTAARLPFTLIKGPARRAAVSRYPYADARSTLDVDLLLPAAAAGAAHNLLLASGYERADESSDSPPDHFHLPPLWNARRVAVEMHTSTSPWITPAEAWRRETERPDQVEWAGRTLTVAPATELFWHALVHAFVDGAAGFRLRGFLDGAVILASGRPIDWSAIERRIASAEVRNCETGAAVADHLLRRWIATAAELSGSPVPAEFCSAGPFPLVRLLGWRAVVLRRAPGRAVRERLLEEATRSMIGMPLTPSPGGTPAWPRTRRRAASGAARAAFHGWTWTQRDSAGGAALGT